MRELRVIGLTTIGEVRKGDDLAKLVVEAAEREGVGIREGDVIVVTSKVVSKAEGRVVKLSEVEPGLRARALAKLLKEPPQFVELVLRESKDVVAVVPVKALTDSGAVPIKSWASDERAAEEALRTFPYMLLTIDRRGLLNSDAGIDASNNPSGYVSLLPADPDESARRIRARVKELTGKDVAVVVADTEVYLAGSLEVAIGVSGIEPVKRGFGAPDRYGRPKFGNVDNVACELACAAALVWGQAAEGIPVVIVRGLEYRRSEEGYPKISHRHIKMLTLSVLKRAIFLAPVLLRFRRS